MDLCTRSEYLGQEQASICQIYMTLRLILTSGLQVLYVKYAWPCAWYLLLAYKSYMSNMHDPALDTYFWLTSPICQICMTLRLILTSGLQVLYVKYAWPCAWYLLLAYKSYMSNMHDPALDTYFWLTSPICQICMTLRLILTSGLQVLYVKYAWPCAWYLLLAYKSYMSNIHDPALDTYFWLTSPICQICMTLRLILTSGLQVLYVKYAWPCAWYLLLAYKSSTKHNLSWTLLILNYTIISWMDVIIKASSASQNPSTN